MTARCMRPVYGCPENFWVSEYAPTLLFPKFSIGICSDRSYEYCVQNLKFVALPVPDIIGGIQKYGQSLDTPTLPFLGNFNGLLFGWTLWTYRPNLKSVALPVPEIIAIEFVDGVANPQSWGRGGRIGGRGWYRSKERWRVPLGLPVHIKLSSIFTRFRDIVAQHATFSHPPLVSPKFPHVPLGVGEWPLGHEERKCWANCPCN